MAILCSFLPHKDSAFRYIEMMIRRNFTPSPYGMLFRRKTFDDLKFFKPVSISVMIKLALFRAHPYQSITLIEANFFFNLTQILQAQEFQSGSRNMQS